MRLDHGAAAGVAECGLCAQKEGRGGFERRAGVGEWKKWGEEWGMMWRAR